MLFAIGYGLQEVLTPKNAKTPVIYKHGILYRPDMHLPKSDILRLTELKTTRKSAKRHFMDEELPETWLAYMKGGCFLLDKDQYDLIVLYLMGNYSPPFPLIYSDTFFFEPEEISSNWSTIIQNKEVLDNALMNDEPPTPFSHCYEWECKYCRYQLLCETLVRTDSIRGIK